MITEYISNLAVKILDTTGYAGAGFLMPPAVGAVVMSVSTIVVALNAQLLRRLELGRDPVPNAPERTPAPAHAH